MCEEARYVLSGPMTRSVPLPSTPTAPTKRIRRFRRAQPGGGFLPEPGVQARKRGEPALAPESVPSPFFTPAKYASEATSELSVEVLREPFWTPSERLGRALHAHAAAACSLAAFKQTESQTLRSRYDANGPPAAQNAGRDDSQIRRVHEVSGSLAYWASSMR